MAEAAAKLPVNTEEKKAERSPGARDCQRHRGGGKSCSARTTNAIEKLREEFKRRIKTQTVLPSVDTVAMLFWALLAPCQINMRKVDGWRTLATTPIDQPIDLAA
jgi:hypothetical protein